MSEPETVPACPYSELTWTRLHSVAVFGVALMPVSPLRVLAFRMLVDGVPAMLHNLGAGGLCLGPVVLEDGALAIDLGMFPTGGDPLEPVWFSRAKADDLDLAQQERQWTYELAERAGRIFAEAPDAPPEEGS